MRKWAGPWDQYMCMSRMLGLCVSYLFCGRFVTIMHKILWKQNYPSQKKTLMTYLLFAVLAGWQGNVSGADTRGRQVSGNSSSGRWSDGRMNSGDLWRDWGREGWRVNRFLTTGRGRLHTANSTAPSGMWAYFPYVRTCSSCVRLACLHVHDLHQPPPAIQASNTDVITCPQRNSWQWCSQLYVRR